MGVDETELGIEYLEEGLVYIEQSIALLEGLRRGLVQSAVDNISREKSLLELDNKYKENYALAIELNYELYKKNKIERYVIDAFEYAERGKAFALKQGMNRVLKMQGLDLESRTILNELESKLFFYEKRIGEMVGLELKASRAKLYEQYLKVNQTYQRTLSSISKRKESQLVFQEIYQNEVKELGELSAYVQNKDLAVLSFFGYGKTLFQFTIAEGTTAFEKITLPDSWVEDVEFVQASLQDLDLTTNIDAAKRFVGLQEDWYQLFMRNIPERVNRICIVPDEVVYGVNFNLLIKNSTPLQLITLPATSYEIVDFSTLDYLLKSKATFEINSISIFLNEKIDKLNRPKPWDIIGFSPSYALRNQQEASEIGNIPLQELAPELEEILPLFSNAKRAHYCGDEATVRNLKKYAQSTARVIHISAHGIVNERDPYLSYLAMAYPSGNSEQFDGDLDLGEIFNLNFDADLAVLSSCDSGTRKAIRGNAKVNLARAFRYANCPSVIMGLWAIDDESSASIFPHFYNELLKGKTGDQSLAAAQMQYLTNRKKEFEQEGASIDDQEQALIALHPYFWAGLAALGKFETMIF